MFRSLLFVGLLLYASAHAFADLEIVVTASRVDEDARTTPAYVRVIPEEKIVQGHTVLDALLTLPDLSIRSSSPGRESVSGGAFGDNGFGRILILIDGRPMNRIDMASINWRTIPLGHVERIEVVKGPQSSQYGDQAVVGAINIITKNSEDFQVWLRGDVSLNMTNRQAFGMTWGDDNLRFKGNVSRENINPARQRSRSDGITGYASAGITLGETDIDLSMDFSHTELQLPGGLTKDEWSKNPNQAKNLEDEVSENAFGLNLTTKSDVENLSILGSLSWQHLESRSDTVSWMQFNEGIHNDLRATIQADMTTAMGSHVVLVPVLGIDLRYSNINLKVFPTASRVKSSSNASPNRIDIGLWTRLKILLGKSWSFDLGVRFAYYNTALEDIGKNGFPIVYDAGIAFVPNDSWALSVRYGRVFRYPFLDEQIQYYRSPSIVNTDLEPEYGHNISLSIEFQSGKFRSAISPYFILMNDEIAFAFVDGQGNNFNMNSTYHYGGTASASWSDDILSFETSYSFDRAQFVDTLKFVPLVPAHTVYSRLAVRPIKTVEIATDIRLTSGYYEGGDFTNEQSIIPERFQWNIRAEWRPMDGEILLYVKAQNLLDNRIPTMVHYGLWYPSSGRIVEFGVQWSH